MAQTDTPERDKIVHSELKRLTKCFLFIYNFLFALMRISAVVLYKYTKKELQKDKSLGYRKSEDRCLHLCQNAYCVFG